MKTNIRTLKLKIKALLLKITGRYDYLKKNVIIKSEWYGNHSAGFYVCPPLINENSIVYSFGIGQDISFDKEIINKHNCTVYGFDPTPKSIDWVKKQNIPEKFKFYEFGISTKNETVEFYLPKNPEYVSGSIVKHENVNNEKKINVDLKSIETILNILNHKHIDVLKMDIEGAEYDVLNDIVRKNISVTQILVEFHERFFENGKNKTKEIVKKLKSQGYEIFGVSHSFEEVSFINTKYITK